MSLTTRVLDLFCCGGGTSRGYQLAGFQVVPPDYTEWIGSRLMSVLEVTA